MFLNNAVSLSGTPVEGERRERGGGGTAKGKGWEKGALAD